MWSVQLQLHESLATAQTLQITAWALAGHADLVRHVHSVVTCKATHSSFLFPRKSLTLRSATLFYKIPGNLPHDLFLLTHHPSSFLDKWRRMRKIQQERTANCVQKSPSASRSKKVYLYLLSRGIKYTL